MAKSQHGTVKHQNRGRGSTRVGFVIVYLRSDCLCSVYFKYVLCCIMLSQANAILLKIASPYVVNGLPPASLCSSMLSVAIDCCRVFPNDREGGVFFVCVRVPPLEQV